MEGLFYEENQNCLKFLSLGMFNSSNVYIFLTTWLQNTVIWYCVLYFKRKLNKNR